MDDVALVVILRKFDLPTEEPMHFAPMHSIGFEMVSMHFRWFAIERAIVSIAAHC